MVRRIGRHGENAVPPSPRVRRAGHIEGTARLEHEQVAEPIEPLARLAPLGEEVGAGDRRTARPGRRSRANAHRFPADAHLNGLDGEGRSRPSECAERRSELM